MSITAQKIGSSPLRLDWTHLTQEHKKVDIARIQNAWSKLKSRFDSQEIGFYSTPVSSALSQHEACVSLAEQLTQQGWIKDVLFLGIGGSSLGPLCLLSALEHKRKNQISFHFVENPDPIDCTLKLKKLAPSSTLICAVTKSGSTFETISLLLVALEWLGRERWKKQVIAITDPAKGDLKKLAQAEGLACLDVAPSIGGRFSVFTPVGLFAAALAGLDTKEFMKGALQVREAFEKNPVDKNPIALIAEQLIEQYSKRPIHVMMPYSTPLRLTADWWVQLWGESLGKDGKGFTPLASIGATDQHSILQLLRDGPDDKVTWFITVSDVENPVRIPKLGSTVRKELGSFVLLEEHSLHDLLLTEYKATALVMTKKNKPHFSIHLDQLDERAMGALFFMLCVLTALTGTLWGVEPFDQPGVEEGKIYTRDMLQELKSDQKL